MDALKFLNFYFLLITNLAESFFMGDDHHLNYITKLKRKRQKLLSPVDHDIDCLDC
jgi:hypothetical protein